MDTIVINLSPIMEFLTLPPAEMAVRLFFLFGWMPIAGVIIYGAKELWIFHRGNQYAGTVPKVFLAIDIPKLNEQTPRAVENIFSYMLGAHATLNLIEKYWFGMFQLSFSFEIVSIDGYTQFIIRTPVVYRNIVESAIYSQYPDAEITEIDDYAKDMPSSFPDKEYDMWGCDFFQKTRHWVYPIKTYEEFEHGLGKEGVQFKDPMASLMDLCSSLNKGEQLWYQLILKPEGFDWMDAGDKEILKILGEKPKATAANNFVDKIVEELGNFSEFIYSLWGNIEPKKEEKADALKMMNLRPKEKKQVEAIQRKVSKLGYSVKPRMIYIAKKEVMNKAKVVNGFIGFIKQFADLDLNNLSPDMDLTATTTNYFFRASRLNDRKRRVMKNYKNRDGGAGRPMFILNVEELATLWHFPLESAVKAPLIQKTAGRKAEPPMTLPIGEQIVSEEILEPLFEEEFSSKHPRVGKEDKSKSVIVEEDDSGQSDFWSIDMAEDTGQIATKKEHKVDRDGTKGAPPANLPFS